MIPRFRSAVALVALLLVGGETLAQRADPQAANPLFSGELPDDLGGTIQDFMDRFSIPRSRFTDGPHLREAFRSVVKDCREATVEIRSRGKRIAYGGVVGPDGWILTKASLIRGAVSCRLKDGREFDARLVGVDSETDLAMLKVAAKNLPTLELGGPKVVASDEFVAIRAEEAFDASSVEPEPSLAIALQPGDWLATVGLVRDPIAVGVVSVLPRPIEKRNGFLGITMDRRFVPSEGQPPAVRIENVTPDSAAEEAGLELGDLILMADSKPTPTVQALGEVIRGRNPGDRVKLKVRRGEEELKLLAILRGWDPNPAERRAYYQNNLGGKLSQRRFGFPLALQHDTVLEPDECGGPIVDLDGRVVGFNIARAGRTESYALPTDEVRGRLFELMSGRLAPVVVETP